MIVAPAAPCARGDLDVLASGGGRVGGVADEVPQDLTQLRGVRRDRQRLVDLAADLDVAEGLVPARDLQRLLDEHPEVEVHGALRPRVGVVEQVANQHVEPRDLAVDDRHQRTVVLRGLRALLEQLDRSRDRGERVADLVRDEPRAGRR